MDRITALRAELKAVIKDIDTNREAGLDNTDNYDRYGRVMQSIEEYYEEC